MKQSISLVLPIYNEAENLCSVVSELLFYLRNSSLKFEIILIDDGSVDSSRELVEKLVSESEEVVAGFHSENRGIGAAFRSGVSLSRMENVAMFSADGENDIQTLVGAFLSAPDYDMLIPYPLTPKRNFGRRLVSSLYTLIINFTFSRRVRYYNGTVIYKRSVIVGMDIPSSFLYQTYIIVILLHRGLRYKEIPVLTRLPENYKSSALTVKNFLKVFRDYSALVWIIYFRRR